MDQTPRLDASESIFFSRELEAIDSRLYNIEFQLLKARQLVPKVNDVGEHQREYTYRQYETFGRAKIIANAADDLPVVEVTGAEFTSRIKPLGLKAVWNLFDIRAAMATGKPLDQMQSQGARVGIETEIDSLLTFGSTLHDMKGFVNHSAVDASTFVATTKAAGGTGWLTAGGAPNATGKEMVADVNALVNQVWAALKENPALGGKLTVVLPAPEYAYLASTPMGDNADKTALKFLLDNNQFIESIQPWHSLSGQGAGTTGRMICYRKDPMVLGAVIPMDFSPQPVQQRGLIFERQYVASCGGVVIRYPVAMAYGDGI